NVLASDQPGEPDHAGDPDGHSVWFSWTAEVTGRAFVRACTFESEFEPLLDIYTGSALDQLQRVATGEEDGEDCGARGSQASFDPRAGLMYEIAVDGRSGEEGYFELVADSDFSFRPPWNDDFDQAIALSRISISNLFPCRNTAATEGPGELELAGDPGCHSV